MMRHWLVIVVFVALGATFFFAPLLSFRGDLVPCLGGGTVYVSLSYEVLNVGLVYIPWSNWVEFPPLFFHNVACSL
jgi:hypothetical protein